jgi:hypothetical protein
VSYVGHVDKSSLYETLFHCNILSKHHHQQLELRCSVSHIPLLLLWALTDSMLQTSCIVFKTPMSLLGGIGSGVAVLGTLLYSLAKKQYAKTDSVATVGSKRQQ